MENVKNHALSSCFAREVKGEREMKNPLLLDSHVGPALMQFVLSLDNQICGFAIYLHLFYTEHADISVQIPALIQRYQTLNFFRFISKMLFYVGRNDPKI
jgi:hypothetical protein